MISKAQAAEILTEGALRGHEILCVLLSIEPSDQPRDEAALKAIALAVGYRHIRKDGINVRRTMRDAGGWVIQTPEGWRISERGKAHLGTLAQFRKHVPIVITDPHQVDSPVVRDGLSRNCHDDEPPREPATRDILVDVDVFGSWASAASRLTAPGAAELAVEALGCARAGNLRAAVVVAWSAAVRVLHHSAWMEHRVEIAELLGPGTGQRRVTRDDMTRLPDGEFLDLCSRVGMLDRAVRHELGTSCLKLRNAAAHPSSLILGPLRVATHFETILLNVLVPFGQRPSE